MIYRIYEQDAETLLDKPESGMGYQIIQASQYDRYQNRKFIVYNSDLAVELNSQFQKNRQRIISEGYSRLLAQVPEIMLETDSIKVLDHSFINKGLFLTEERKISKVRYTDGTGATDNPMELANGSDIYVRISAYENDKRINFEEKKLKPGTFTTTLHDYKNCVGTNDDPIDRYALPNDEPIKYSFYIQPKSIDFLQKGVVQPAFGKAGGGIEAFFARGTSKNTYLFKRNYGQ